MGIAGRNMAIELMKYGYSKKEYGYRIDGILVSQAEYGVKESAYDSPGKTAKLPGRRLHLFEIIKSKPSETRHAISILRTHL
ncbi:hypothetical protein CEXT_171941 [Caerostris extrusa]|uniref:Uncharacterized protein n=1 Tax=Caerostris extrusa TaxID=172846 RepID=A0AAV4V4R5_CAEEX|nr:hypothetical protein CEXT_171941 [Caerostris extrusa]